jgi:hypothetical protein
VAFRSRNSFGRFLSKRSCRSPCSISALTVVLSCAASFFAAFNKLSGKVTVVFMSLYFQMMRLDAKSLPSETSLTPVISSRFACDGNWWTNFSTESDAPFWHRIVPVSCRTRANSSIRNFRFSTKPCLVEKHKEPDWDRSFNKSKPIRVLGSNQLWFIKSIKPVGASSGSPLRKLTIRVVTNALEYHACDRSRSPGGRRALMVFRSIPVRRRWASWGLIERRRRQAGRRVERGFGSCCRIRWAGRECETILVSAGLWQRPS